MATLSPQPFSSCVGFPVFPGTKTAARSQQSRTKWLALLRNATTYPILMWYNEV